MGEVHFVLTCKCFLNLLLEFFEEPKSALIIPLPTKKSRAKSGAYHTQGSQAVSDPSTNCARHCLTCEIRRVRVHSTWYGGRHGEGTHCALIYQTEDAHNSLPKHNEHKITSTIDN